MSITPIQPPQPSAQPTIAPIALPAVPLGGGQPSVEAPQVVKQSWFLSEARSLQAWRKDQVPLPVTGNRVVPYITISSYYTALGHAVQLTRANIADFIYISGWILDLDTWIRLPNNERKTLRQLLEAAAQRGVEIRVLLDDTANKGHNLSVVQDIAKMGGGGLLDPFHRLTGSQHQKSVMIRNAEGVVAFCGGCDIDNNRLGRGGLTGNETIKELTQERRGAAWHDVQVRVEGPAVADLWQTFVSRFQETLIYNLSPEGLIKPIPTYGSQFLRQPNPADSQRIVSDLEVQVVRTFPNRSKRYPGDAFKNPLQQGYSFSPNGEMGIYSLLTRAIAQTRETIYLEDQYLVNSQPMGNLPAITKALQIAIEQPSFKKMVIAVAGTGTIQADLFQAGSRRAEFIQQLGSAAAQKVSIYVYKSDDNSPYWFHSKTWIFDDRFAVISSANCNRRSYSCDSEIGIGVTEHDIGSRSISFARRLRMDLWLKHLNTYPVGQSPQRKLTDSDVQDFVQASALWNQSPLFQEQRANFLDHPAADISLSKSPHAQSGNAKFKWYLGETLVAYNALRAKYTGSARDFEWSLIDPNGH